MEMEGLKTSDYYFDLPKELIAQDPLEDRSASRLLVMDRQTGRPRIIFLKRSVRS